MFFKLFILTDKICDVNAHLSGNKVNAFRFRFPSGIVRRSYNMKCKASASLFGKPTSLKVTAI